jgi:DNA helicase HerA-like ATPase
VINILAAEKLVPQPEGLRHLPAVAALRALRDLPEVGDLDKPKLVFFFDEAHLLFTDAPKALLTTIEQVVRLIRSKGVGIYFVTQNPSTSPTPCWANWATASSTRCAPSVRATRRP